MLSFGLQIGDAGGRRRGVVVDPSPAGPAAITDYDLEDGANDGELDFTINTPPDGGDGAAAGDGLGSVTGYEWRPQNYPRWFSLAGEGPHTLATPLLPGETLKLQFRALGYLGRAGAITTTADTTVPGAAVDVIYVVDADGNRVVNADGKQAVVLVPTV